ncbi:MAG: YcgL domain-containing protein [Gammaproteobacteria bacterium]
MQAYIYRCSRKPDMYIYLAERDDFSKVPAVVMNGLGITEFAMELEITEDRQLARVDASKVLQNMKTHGFHLQLPAQTTIDELMKRIASGK